MAAVPVHGKQTRVLCDEKDLSPFLREVSVSAEMEPAEVTTFGDNDREYIPGLRNATISFDGLFAASTTPADDIVNFLDGALGGSTKHVYTVDLTRSTGGRALLVNADNTTYDVSVPVEDVVSCSVDAQVSGGYRGGRMLRPLAAATSTGSNSAVLTVGTTSAGGTTSGGVAHLHVTAISAASVTFRIQHSTSGSTWATAHTFTAATAATFQRSTISGTIKEQVRATISTFTTSASTAADSVTGAVAFARNAGKT